MQLPFDLFNSGEILRGAERGEFEEGGGCETASFSEVFWLFQQDAGVE